jgi:hypothetical protein
METLTEITQRELEARERAARYESLLGSLVQLHATIKRLEAEAKSVEPLRRIVALVEEVPRELLTSGRAVNVGIGMRGGLPTFTIPGQLILQDVLRQVANDGLEGLERREAKRVRQLDAAKADLARVEAELKEFDGEPPQAR